MNDYRIFFLGSDGAIEARQDFSALDDEAAIQIATVIALASADVHYGALLWEGARRVFEIGRVLPNVISLASLSPKSQQCAVDCEETLLNSHWRLAKSGTLSKAAQEAREAMQSQSAVS